MSHKSSMLMLVSQVWSLELIPLQERSR